MKKVHKTFEVFRFILGKFSIGWNVTSENNIENFAIVQLH